MLSSRTSPPSAVSQQASLSDLLAHLHRLEQQNTEQAAALALLTASVEKMVMPSRGGADGTPATGVESSRRGSQVGQKQQAATEVTSKRKTSSPTRSRSSTARRKSHASLASSRSDAAATPAVVAFQVAPPPPASASIVQPLAEPVPSPSIDPISIARESARARAALVREYGEVFEPSVVEELDRRLAPAAPPAPRINLKKKDLLELASQKEARTSGTPRPLSARLVRPTRSSKQKSKKKKKTSSDVRSSPSRSPSKSTKKRHSHLSSATSSTASINTSRTSRSSDTTSSRKKTKRTLKKAHASVSSKKKKKTQRRLDDDEYDDEAQPADQLFVQPVHTPVHLESMVDLNYGTTDSQRTSSTEETMHEGVATTEATLVATQTTSQREHVDAKANPKHRPTVNRWVDRTSSITPPRRGDDEKLPDSSRSSLKQVPAFINSISITRAHPPAFTDPNPFLDDTDTRRDDARESLSNHSSDEESASGRREQYDANMELIGMQSATAPPTIDEDALKSAVAATPQSDPQSCVVADEKKSSRHHHRCRHAKKDHTHSARGSSAARRARTPPTHRPSALSLTSPTTDLDPAWWRSHPIGSIRLSSKSCQVRGCHERKLKGREHRLCYYHHCNDQNILLRANNAQQQQGDTERLGAAEDTPLRRT